MGVQIWVLQGLPAQAQESMGWKVQRRTARRSSAALLSALRAPRAGERLRCFVCLSVVPPLAGSSLNSAVGCVGAQGTRSGQLASSGAALCRRKPSVCHSCIHTRFGYASISPPGLSPGWTWPASRLEKLPVTPDSVLGTLL